MTLLILLDDFGTSGECDPVGQLDCALECHTDPDSVSYLTCDGEEQIALQVIAQSNTCTEKSDGLSGENASIERVSILAAVTPGWLKPERGTYFTVGIQLWRLAEVAVQDCMAQLDLVRPFLPCLKPATIVKCSEVLFAEDVSTEQLIGNIDVHVFNSTASDVLVNESRNLRDRVRVYFSGNVTWEWELGHFIRCPGQQDYRIVGTRNVDLIDRPPYLEAEEVDVCCEPAE